MTCHKWQVIGLLLGYVVWRQEAFPSITYKNIYIWRIKKALMHVDQFPRLFSFKNLYVRCLASVGLSFSNNPWLLSAYQLIFKR
jgi:hypothetical protein